MKRILSPGVLIGLAASGLWLLTGAVYIVLAYDSIPHRLLGMIGIGQLQAQFWVWPGLWPLAALLLSAAVLTSVSVLISDRPSTRGNAFLVGWMSVIIATAVLGLVIDIARVIDVVAQSGVNGLSIASLESTARASFWGILVGWLPALIVFAPLQARETPRRNLALFGTALLSAILLLGVALAGDEAHQQQVAAENAASQPYTDDSGAYIDPAATGEPVPLTAPGMTLPELDPTWCTPEVSMLLLGASDAATGHRGQAITLMNFSEEPCVIDGYADIAFADQNGHVLDVGVAPGSGFMATDPGPSLITVPAQGQAIMFITWDANSTNGALVARSLHAAATPGMQRGSWPVVLDVVEGSSVEITAWSLDTQGVGAP